MNHADESPSAVQMPADGVFVVFLRSDSAVRDCRLYGRVEHVKSGDGQRFGCLEDLLGFMARHSESTRVAGEGNG